MASIASSQADGIIYSLDSCSYSASEGGTLTVGVHCAPFTSTFDISWYNAQVNGASTTLTLTGNGTHPIVTSGGSPDAPQTTTCNFPGTAFFGSGTTRYFTINFNNNTSLQYDRTGTISVASLYTSANCQSASVSLLDDNSVISAFFVSGGLNYATWTLIRGEGTTNVTFRVARGDSLNARTVYYTVSGNAVSGTDYTVSPALNGSVTIPAGSSSVDFALSARPNTNMVGTKTLNVALQAGQYSPSEYQITNGNAFLGILQDAPIIGITAPSQYAAQTNYYNGQFAITRSGGLSNALTVNLIIGGTATAGSDYIPLPSSVNFAIGQTVTNLNVIVTNTSVSVAKTVILSLATNRTYFPDLFTNATVTIVPNGFDTNSVTTPVARYWRGSGTDPTYWSEVVPLDYQTGTVYSNVNGNCSALYPGISSWTSPTLYHYDATNTAPQTNIANRIPFNNPIVAFGERTGGTPLYFSQPYNFGIYGGDPILSNQPVIIQAYYRTNYQLAGSINIYPPTYYQTNAWTSFSTNGFQFTTNAFGLTTSLSGAAGLAWGQISFGAFVLTHTASTLATNYYYAVEVAGNPQDNSNPMVISGSGQMAPSLLYSLEFEARPPWRSVFLDQPHFNGAPLPPFYSGKTLTEMLTNTPPVTNTVSFTPSAATNLDASPELRRHPILDNFVASMGKDPIALANYVINQIGLTDPMDYSDNGNVAENSINPSGVTRGALGTFMEKQGSPIEQCALLVYLLRQAGVPAVYEYAPHNGLEMLDARLSQMLKFQVHGDLNQAGQPYTTNTMIPVNYPWVAAYIGTNWVHIFPWLKDYRIEEGLNLFEVMPTNYSTAYEWVHDYIYGATNLLSLAVNGDNTPRVIFPRYLQQTLLQNHPGVSVDDVGVKIINRQHYYARWQDFPTPTWVTNVSTPLESLSSSTITNINPALTNIFDTLSVEIYSQTDPTKDIRTGDLRLVDLHNREFYIYQTVTNSTYVNLSLVLVPFRPGVSNQLAFSNDTNLLAKEVLSMTLDAKDYALGVRFHYHRHRSITPAYGINPYLTFLGFNAFNEIDIERPLYVGDQAAICLDYGQVTRDMLNVHAADLWQMQNTLNANPSLAASQSPDVYEGATMYMAGMSYYEKVSEFNQLNQQLQKIDQLSFFGAGLSKIIPLHDAYGHLSNGTDPVLPCVDMNFFESASLGNGTLHPDSGQYDEMTGFNYILMNTADQSAEEHQVINRFYQQTNAVSTVRLLQLAQATGGGIVPLTIFNYTAQGQASYQGAALQSWDAGMWQEVVSEFQSSFNGGYMSAFMTPGPITNGAYKGMGVMVLSPHLGEGLISPSSLNGGFAGQDLPANTVAAANTPNYMLKDNNDNYSISLTQPASQTTLVPGEVAGLDAAAIAVSITSGLFAGTPFIGVWAANSSSLLGLPAGGSGSALATDVLTGEQSGFVGTPNDGGAQTGSKVADPVNNITGEFYVNETDLQLPGPIPLALRRNYSSQDLADNQFGYGWKLSIMPFLSLSKNLTNIYAADMDGAVLAYVHSTNSATTNMWFPTLAANPQLNNNTTAGVGGMANRLRDYIVRSVNGSITNYTLYGADGSVRLFQYMKLTGGAITNTRPNLLKWTDNRGNYYTFAYDTNAVDANFGQMTRIQCSNGNYMDFDYDIYGHMIDAYSGDGRWMYYDYDDFGDLVTVTLPDNTTRAYQYLHSTQSVTNAGVVTKLPYSTHLIIEEDRPDGRALINAYDSQRRVTNQLSTVGTDLNPIRTATFVYTNNFNITNSFTNTISGSTFVIDGNNHTNRYDYTNNLITQITDPLGQTIQQVWFSDTNAAGYYPRSVQQRTDKRGLVSQYQYDSNGNVTNTIVTGDLTGDGITTQTATNTAIYNTNNLPLQMADPAGNGIVTVYDPVFTFLPQQIIRYAGATPVSTNFVFYGNATNVVVNGSLTQSNLAFGLPVRQIRAYGSPDAATNDLTYDGHGFVTQSIRYTGTGDPSITNTYFYNERGQLVNQVDPLGAVTFLDYDALDRPIASENDDEFGNALSWSFNYYNDNGELMWTDGPRYNPEDYVFYDYDGAGRRSTEIHWRSEAKAGGTGVEAPAGYNQYAQSFYQYDVLGNLTLAVDPRGAMITNNWDALCRLVQRRHLDTDGVTVLSSEGFSYEPGGQVQNYTNALGGVGTTRYTITGKPEARSNPNGSTNGWRYYLDGRVKREIQSNGAFWQTIYDDVNRSNTRIFYSAVGVPEATNTVRFDRRGNVVQGVDAGNNQFTTLFDDLDRARIIAGPAITNVLVTQPGGLPSSPIVYVTNIVQQVSTNFYDAAGRALTNVNARGESAVTRMDALGRVVSVQIYSPSGALVRENYTTYSADHNSVTSTDGSGATAIGHATWTDNEGRVVLSVAYPSVGVNEFTLNQYDLAGNLTTAQHDSSASGSLTTWTTTSLTYDGLNHLTGKVDRDGAPTTYAYDTLGGLTNRTMPGGLQWQASYNNAGQMLQERNVGNGNATRTNTYTYYASGSPFAGLLQTKADGRGVSCTYAYDDWLRPTNMVYSGSLPEQNLTTTWQYEPRGFVTNITEQFASTNTGPATSVQRTFDQYGQLAVESVNGGSFTYGTSQSWDPAGRRSLLNVVGGSYGFTWQADGSLQSVSGITGGGTYAYDTAGLLTNRLVGTRTTRTTSRDGEGRPLAVTTIVSGTPQLTESLSWLGDGLLASHTLSRTDFTDSRSYAYASQSRRLVQEQQNLNASATWTNTLAYDNGAAAGPGVLTSSGSGSNLWAGVPDSFSRIGIETNNNISFVAYGHANGLATFSVFLDSQPVSVTSTGTNALRWRATMELSPGTHQLTVAAAHPSGQFIAWATNSFTNNLAYQTTADGFDSAGNITQRLWLNPDGTTNRTQTLSWDARGRLHKVSERDGGNSGFDWTANYDGLNRRLQITTLSISNGIALTAQPAAINSYFDPQAEFLELGVAYGNKTEWKLYGPDLNGQYGGANGTGGFDGVSPGLGVFNPTVSDVRGNILGSVTNGVLSWNPARPTGFGAVPGYRPVALGNGASIALSSAWRGRWVDLTGCYNLGMRVYDPVSGRWLSGDSSWNEHDPNYYSFAGGDPINGFDPDGRMSRSDYQNSQNDLTFNDKYNAYVEGGGSGWLGSFYSQSSELQAYFAGKSWDGLTYGERMSAVEIVAGGTFQQVSYNYSAPKTASVSDVANILLNTDAKNYAANEWNNADWNSGWGITMKFASGIDYAANTVDGAANMIPIVGGIKAGIGSVIKVGIEDVTKQFTKGAEENIVKQVEDTIVKKPYSNPANRPAYGDNQVSDVWENAKGPDGLVRDPNTQEILNWDPSQSRYDQWHMGHTPGNDYATLHEKYMNGEISKEEFLKEYRNPNNYRPEAPMENMSHKWE